MQKNQRAVKVKSLMFCQCDYSATSEGARNHKQYQAFSVCNKTTLWEENVMDQYFIIGSSLVLYFPLGEF